MLDKWSEVKSGSQAKDDFLTAAKLNGNNFDEFILTDGYKTYHDAHGVEGLFQAFSRHWCGEEYSGPLQHFIEDEKYFKT